MNKKISTPIGTLVLVIALLIAWGVINQAQASIVI